MKKLSISLFAVVIMIFAVTTAFTTSSNFGGTSYFLVPEQPQEENFELRNLAEYDVTPFAGDINTECLAPTTPELVCAVKWDFVGSELEETDIDTETPDEIRLIDVAP